MGTRRTGDGGHWPPEGDNPREEPPGLPGLPPEWGRIVIPDDPSALAEEAEQVRWELARRRTRPFSAHRSTHGGALLLMAGAVLVTLLSLFVMAWSGSTFQRTVPPARPMPAITLTELNGRQVALETLGPAAILLVEECECDNLIRETAAAAPSGVNVIVIDSAAPSGDLPPPGVRWLLDPNAEVRGALGLSPPTGAAGTVLLVNAQQALTQTIRTTTVRSFQGGLERLQPRSAAAVSPLIDAAARRTA